MALDKNYNILCLLRYTNLQWRRKYYEPGTFSMQIPLEQYDSDIKYIYTKDRPELGVVTQKNYIVQDGYNYMSISGFFLENEINRMAVYPLQTTGNITGQPTWTVLNGPAETVALQIYNSFKSIYSNQNGTQVNSYLDIVAESGSGRGAAVEYTREGKALGQTIYELLKESEMTYSVVYDFVNSTKRFKIWQGKDRTQDNTEENNPVKFSTRNGTIKNPNVLINESNYRNAIIMENDYTENDADIVRLMVKYKAGRTGDTNDSFEFVSSSVNKSDYNTAAEYENALQIDATRNLYEYYTVINVEFDTIEGSYDYMEDFDLGDKCDIIIPEMKLEAEARLIGCYETIKDGTWTLTMEFGTPMIK